MSLGRLLELFLEEMRGQGRATGTRQQIRSTLPFFFEHLRRKRINNVRRVTEAHVVSYACHLQRAKSHRGGPLAPATQETRLMAVKRFFAFLTRRGMLLRDPAVAVPVPTARVLPRALSEHQVRRFMTTPDANTPRGLRDRAILELLYGTGIRMGECQRMDLADMDLLKGTVLIRDGKGRKDRYVPLVGRAYAALDLYLRESRPHLARHQMDAALFLTQYGRRFRGASLCQMMQCYRAAGTGNVTCHVLRHSYATHLLQGGADVREVQELLGHRRIATTARYTRVNIRDLARAVARAHPRERRPRRRKR
jgi:integrase/recombinase XerD